MNDNAPTTNARTAPQIPTTPVENSSQIKAVGYDEASETLAVEFVDTPGRTYHYHGFKRGTWDAFQDAPSKGSFFYNHIKGQYGYDRVEADGTISKSAAGPNREAEQQAA